MTDSYLHHVAIVVKDISTSVTFYTVTFDAKVLYQDKTWALLSLNSRTNIALVLKDQHPPHIAIVTDIATVCASELKTHRDGIRYKYIKDPSGNVIEILDPKSSSS